MTGEMLGWADVWPESFASYHDINSGANSLSVSYGHCMSEKFPCSYHLLMIRSC